MVKVTNKGDKAWVTFSLMPENVDEVAICGEWNNWEDEPMKVKKNGEFYITKILSTDKDYQFGYRLNNSDWQCESELESIQTPFGSHNALLKF